MSLKEIIKKQLTINNLAFSKLTTKNTHCQNKQNEYCHECKVFKNKLCNKKLIFLKFQQINFQRYHFYFKCENNHFVIRYVIVNSNDVVIGNLKN